MTKLTESSPQRPAVCADELLDDPQLARWAKLGDWPILPTEAWLREPLALQRDAKGLWLVGRSDKLRGRAQVDLVGGRLGDRLRRGVGTSEALARAVGARAGCRPHVIDLTLGWMRDSALLSSLGCRVLGRERSPVMAALIEDGLTRAQAEPRLAELCDRLSWEFVPQEPRPQPEAITQTLRSEGKIPILLMDPMFPERDASALVRLPLRLAGAVVGADLDAPQLLASALNAEPARVVVRRPRGAPPIESPRLPDLVVDGGRTTRFDVYFGPS